MDPPADNEISAGDVHLGVWPDFYFGYIFVSKEEARRYARLLCLPFCPLFLNVSPRKSSVGTASYAGGYNIRSLAGAERWSLNAFSEYARLAPPVWLNRSSLNGSFLGTCTGLSKMPYIVSAAVSAVA